MEGCVTHDSDRGRARFAQLCLGALFVLAAIVAAFLVVQASPPVHAADLLLIYVGADDCAPCRGWQRGDGAAFRNSTYFRHVTYREVKPAHLRDLLNNDSWPPDIQGYRERLSQRDGVPLWLVVLNDDIVLQRFGAVAWRSEVLPKIRRYVRVRRS